MISNADRDRVGAAVKQAEAGTSGQILCVLAERSAEYASMDALYAALVALLVPWPLISFTQLPTPIILAIQSAVFAALLLLFSVAPLTTALVPSRVKRRNGFRAAT
jgi:putative membrane protein